MKKHLLYIEDDFERMCDFLLGEVFRDFLSPDGKDKEAIRSIKKGELHGKQISNKQEALKDWFAKHNKHIDLEYSFISALKKILSKSYYDFYIIDRCLSEGGDSYKQSDLSDIVPEISEIELAIINRGEGHTHEGDFLALKLLGKDKNLARNLYFLTAYPNDSISDLLITVGFVKENIIYKSDNDAKNGLKSKIRLSPNALRIYNSYGSVISYLRKLEGGDNLVDNFLFKASEFDSENRIDEVCDINILRVIIGTLKVNPWYVDKLDKAKQQEDKIKEDIANNNNSQKKWYEVREEWYRTHLNEDDYIPENIVKLIEYVKSNRNILEHWTDKAISESDRNKLMDISGATLQSVVFAFLEIVRFFMSKEQKTDVS